jgi:hypothetical protein
MAIATNIPRWMERAIWEGNQDLLHERAPCKCCCYDHTFDHCQARLWGGCRGQGKPTKDDLDEWARHYGMTAEEFLA